MRSFDPIRCGLRAWGSAALVALALALSADSVEAAIYKYTDRHGVTHYSDSYESVPPAYRDQVRDVAGDVQEMTGFNVIEGLNGGPATGAGAADSSAPFGASLGGADMLRGVLGSLGFGVILLFLLAIPIVLAIGGLILQLACRIGGAEPPGLGRAIGILFVQSLAGGAVGAVANGFAAALDIDEAALAASSLALGGVTFLLSWAVNAAVLTAMAGCDFLRALWVCVVHTVLVLLLVFGPIAAIAALVWLKG